MSRKGKPEWLQKWQKENGSGNRKIDPKEYPRIQKMYYEEMMSTSKIAKEFDVAQSCIYKLFKKQGWKIRSKSEANSNNICTGLRNWRKEKGSWNKGLTKSDSRISSLIEKGRQTQIKNGKSKGKNNPMWGKVAHSRVGFRKDLGHYVRSSWEANFARILISFRISYEYEKQTFILKDGRTYTPDFFIPSKNKFYEVKGWDNGNKWQTFVQENPEFKFCVVNEKIYSKLMLKFGHRIVVEDNESFFTKEELLHKYFEFVKNKKCRSVRKFCKHLGISNKTVIRLFGSESGLSSLYNPLIY